MDCIIRKHIRFAPEQRRQILPQLDQVHERCIRLHADEKVDVTRLVGGSFGERSKYAEAFLQSFVGFFADAWAGFVALLAFLVLWFAIRGAANALSGTPATSG